jgi:hypothetical protein
VTNRQGKVNTDSNKGKECYYFSSFLLIFFTFECKLKAFCILTLFATIALIVFTINKGKIEIFLKLLKNFFSSGFPVHVGKQQIGSSSSRK